MTVEYRYTVHVHLKINTAHLRQFIYQTRLWRNGTECCGPYSPTKTSQTLFPNAEVFVCETILRSNKRSGVYLRWDFSRPNRASHCPRCLHICMQLLIEHVVANMSKEHPSSTNFQTSMVLNNFPPTTMLELKMHSSVPLFETCHCQELLKHHRGTSCISGTSDQRGKASKCLSRLMDWLGLDFAIDSGSQLLYSWTYTPIQDIFHSTWSKFCEFWAMAYWLWVNIFWMRPVGGRSSSALI